VTRVRRLVGVFAPRPWRGPLAASGAVLVTAGLLMAQLRLGWPAGAELGLDGLAALGLGAMVAGSELEFGRARSYQVVIAVCALVLAGAALLALARLGGAPADAGTTAWILSVLAGLALALAVTRNLATGTLIAGAAGAGALVAWAQRLAHPAGSGTARGVLLVSCLGFVVASLGLRDARPRHAVGLVNLAGLCALAILGLLASDHVPVVTAPHGAAIAAAITTPVGWGWKFFLLIAALGLIAYAGADREAGAGYLGALLLAGTAALIAVTGGRGTVLGWPLILLALGGGVLVAALRPSRPLPPEPGDGRSGGVVALSPREPPPLDSPP